MEEKYKNLAAACTIFTEKLDLSIDQNLACLDSSIEQGYIDRNALKDELKLAFNDQDFKWLAFALEQKLIVYNIESYTNEEVREYVKSLIWDYLYPDSNIV